VHGRSRRLRARAWLGIAALALPLLAQLAHRAPGAADEQLWDVSSLCLTSGLPAAPSAPEPDRPRHGPAGAAPRCPVCLTLHAAASFLPTTGGLELPAPRLRSLLALVPEPLLPGALARFDAEPRAPPLTA
jgi:hypothetical protein